MKLGSSGGAWAGNACGAGLLSVGGAWAGNACGAGPRPRARPPASPSAAAAGPAPQPFPGQPSRTGPPSPGQPAAGPAPQPFPGQPSRTGPPSPGQPAAGGTPGPQRDRVLTVPNVISLARLLGVPVFLWLVLGPKADGWAVGLLVAAGLSDWLDGKIARAWNQQSRLGQLLDPAADRLYIAATLVSLAVRAIIPWWLVGLLVGRELVLGGALLALRRHGYGPLQVSLVGKTATLCLLYAFPLLFLGEHAGTAALVARVTGWAFAIWGSALYWWAAGLYLTQTRRLLRPARNGGASGVRGGPGTAGGLPQ